MEDVVPPEVEKDEDHDSAKRVITASLRMNCLALIDK